MNDRGYTESLSILPACLPSLPAGRYSLEVEQTVKDIRPASGKKDAEYGKESIPFHVSAPRSSLDAALVYSVYPPKGAKGYFSDCLPHVVLGRRTLPWERVLAHGNDGAKRAPWLALLLLDEDELRVDDHASRKTEIRPLRELDLPIDEAIESGDDRYTILELPARLFGEVAPSRTDLPHLAHVRRIEAGDMASDGVADAGWFSVVVCNRLPTPDKEHEAFLVSLEGLEEHLPDGNTPPVEDDGKTVTIVVLASWRFTNNGTKKGFREIITTLRGRTGPLRLRDVPGPDEPVDLEAFEALEKEVQSEPRRNAEKIARAITDVGYVPLAHTTRRGDRTISWYRGPLVPLFLPTEQLIEFSCADAALRYDSYLGLFDVSYAAAWQLGRLLALQNQHFSRALHALARRERDETFQREARQEFLKRFGAEIAGRPSRETTFEDAVVQLLGGDPTAGGTDGSPRVDSGEIHLPAELTQWLGRLFLLHGVPLSYLVSHPKLLEPETIGLFYLDPAWVAALLDGALSLARSSATPLLLERAMAGDYLRVQSLPDDPPNETDEHEPLIVSHVTGFLMRSELVSGWRGVKVAAYNASEVRLEVLRMERVADDVLLCIYNGKIGRVQVTEPPHGVYFGLTERERGEWEKNGIPVGRRNSGKALEIAKLAADLKVSQTEFVARMIVPPLDVTLDLEHIEPLSK